MEERRQRVEIERTSWEEKCNEYVGYKSQKGKRVMDIHLDETVMTYQGKLKVIV